MRLPLVTRHNTNRIKISTRILASTMHCYITMKCLLKMQPGYCSPQYCIYLGIVCDVNWFFSRLEILMGGTLTAGTRVRPLSEAGKEAV